MSQLRKEYSKSKSKKDEIVSKAALNWLAENVIIINEKLDRKSVKRLIKSIQKFEDTFGPFADQVPSIKLHLDAAETGLELVVTGRSSDRKTSNLLKQMSYLYSSLSGFFAKDLPILLKSRFFRAAKEQPDQRMDMLPSETPEGHKHNPQVIQDAIATALKPDKDEKKLLKKMYRSTKLPELEPRKIARELMSLSYNDLESLTQIGKTPMVTTPDEVVEEPETPEAPEQEVAAESVFRHTGQLLTEGMLTEASLSEVGPVLQQLTSIVKSAGLDALEGPLNDLYTQLVQYLNSDKGTQLKQSIQQAKAKGGSIADLFKTPGGKLLKQANMAIETLKGLGQAWPDIQPFTQKPQVSDKDILDIKQLISKQVGGGFFKKAAQAFGVTTRPFPGLEPESIVDALTKSTLGEEYMRFHAGVVLERRIKEQTETGAAAGAGDAVTEPPAGDEAAKGVQKLATAMSALHQFATGASGSAKTTGAQASTSTGRTQQTQNTSSTSGTETVGTGPASGKEVAGVGSKESIGALKQSFPNLTDKQYDALAAGLDGAGYKIVKK